MARASTPTRWARATASGNKMWISAGEHELTENIVHLVLAKIPDADGKLVPGTKGISLFIVPKKLVDTKAAADRRAQRRGAGRAEPQAGLARHHQHAAELRRRQVTRWIGQAGAVGYLVGQPGEGLRCMFHMMNEARIGVGMGAVMLGMAGYEASLDYARAPQGRPPARRQGRRCSRRCRIMAHADVRRMLLAQKAYVRRRLALGCTARAWWTSSTPATSEAARRGGPAAGPADAHRQELAQRSGAWRPTAWPSRSTAATATRATTPWSSSGATTA
jgi:alkylation response protein AidB-like acyl-CoA dehydrogenase